ncbi:sensor histidine kinase [Amycolatopsis sp. NBC_01480]|uniref:sensor histidine kinase n=1 Tax=Amycolatopsis sp. NBC_01480 TaxID=2903562 RepID=UPI002E29915A|nr:histidine kinase [Amycolatopsis sp. NBC_01480]
MAYPTAVRRAFALAGLALLSWLDVLVELVTFVLLCVGLVFFLPSAILWARGRSRRTRALAGSWCGVEVPSPYRPEPPAPERERDGWYRDGNQLFRRSWWIRVNRRINWVLEDPAVGRELVWQLVNPLAGLVLVPAAVLCGPRALRAYGRWTRRWLGSRTARPRGRWLHRHSESLGHQIGILVLGLIHLVLAFAQLVALPFFPSVVVAGRAVPDTARREIHNWTGIRIPRPYLPPPPLPVPRADGLFQVGKQLYEEPWWPVRRARFRWILRDPATWRDLLAAVLVPFVSAVLLIPTVVLTFWGIGGLAALWAGRFISGWPAAQQASTRYFEVIGLPTITSTGTALAITPVALAALVLGLAPTTWLARQQARFARLVLGPTEAIRLAQRVRRLDQTRSDVTVAQAAELRRIERDLHDGIQSRLVAMGMKLGAVEALIDSDPAAAKKLAADLRTASAEALTELRVLVRGIHPPVLSERGLLDAVRAVALDSPLKTEVTGSLAGRVEEPVEACAYFAVCELLGNAAKHGAARRVTISLEHSDGLLRVEVADDGKGGADAARGSGLRGIERRLGGFDGRLTLTSPLGGPTVAIVEVPCQLDPEPSSPKTSTSSETA